MSGKNRKSLIPQYAADIQRKESKFFNTNPSVMHAIGNEGDNNAHVFVSLRFVQYDHQCFSDWSKTEMKAFWNFSEKLHNYTWNQVYASASKGAGKTGLAYTLMPADKYPDSAFRNSLDPQTTLFELRVDGESRIHGFRDKAIFYVCWLDKNHEVG